MANKQTKIAKLERQQSEGNPRAAARKYIVSFLFQGIASFLAVRCGATTVYLIGHNRGCLLKTKLFFSLRCTYIVFKVSCTQKGVVGSIVGMDKELHRIDPHISRVL
jgi:hypothetical protein